MSPTLGKVAEVARAQMAELGVPGVAVGVAWLSVEVGGTRVVQHGGSWLNQLSTFRMVPERGEIVWFRWAGRIHRRR